MTSAHYQLDWPRENLTVRCFVHDVMNYRYHWHEDDYELSILLHGTQEYCRGKLKIFSVPGKRYHPHRPRASATLPWVHRWRPLSFVLLFFRVGLSSRCYEKGRRL